MLEKSPFHPCTSALCTSMYWKDWAGYYAVRSFGACYEKEYYAFRHSAGLLDVTPAPGSPGHTSSVIGVCD